MPQLFYDALSELSLGINSGVAALLLPKNQCAFATNATFRGGYIQPRPALQKQNLNFGGDAALQTLVEKGLFQGGGVYRPDFGPSQILAQIAGHLIVFTPTDTDWTVVDKSIVGDLNNATTNQVWMWQSEKWMVIEDGTGALPIFYDGVSARRSFGPSVVLGTVTGTSVPTPPAIGDTVDATMAALYSGPYDVPVLFNGAFYQPVGSGTAGQYLVVLTNLKAAAGAVIPSGSQISVQPNNAGYVTTPQYITQTGVVAGHYSSEARIITGSNVLSLGDVFIIGTRNWTVNQIFAVGGNQTHVQLISPQVPPDPGPNGVLVGTLLQYASSPGPVVIIGTTNANFTNPAVNGTVTVNITSPYTGPAGQTVWIGTEEYTIQTAPPPAPSLTVTLINLSDTSTGAYTFNQDLLSVPELPAGRMGAYGLGQNWISLTDGISFMVGDIVGSAAGTQANNYRDAVLKTTGLTFLGGNFRLPGSGNIITSMTFVANLDTSLGQGPLQIGTDSSMFSCIAPFDFTNPPASNIPILTESLIGQGPLGQNSTILCNSDTLFRSVEGLGSLKIARRDFVGDLGGNTPISREVERIISRDNISLLPYGSAVNFDNRYLITCAPAVSGQGVFHQGVIALNFDLVSSLRGKAPPVYDGLWTGLNILQTISGNFSGQGRAFMFGLNISPEVAGTPKIELYELLRQDSPQKFDNGSTRITWSFESPIIFNADVKPISEYVRLTNGEFYVQDVIGTVDWQLQFRPDHFPCWIDWSSGQICSDIRVTNGKPGYRSKIGVGEPSPTPCEENNNLPFRVGRFFQTRWVFTGHCKFMGARFEAAEQSKPNFPAPDCAPECGPDLPIPP